MTGYEYEQKCAQLLKGMGYTNVKVTPGSGDQGIDVIARKGGKKYGIQCKYYEGTVGNKAVQEAFSGAAYYDCDVAMVITSSTLTAPAKTLARKLNVQIMEGIDAVYLMKHDKAYQEQKRQKEEKRREEEAKIRRLLQEEEARFAAEFKRNASKYLPQWKTQYRSVVLPLIKRTESELKQLVQKTGQELANYDAKCREIEQRHQALIAEREALAETIYSQSLFTFVFRSKKWSRFGCSFLTWKLQSITAPPNSRQPRMPASKPRST